HRGAASCFGAAAGGSRAARSPRRGRPGADSRALFVGARGGADRDGIRKRSLYKARLGYCVVPRELTIDGVRIADDTDCWVIAEIGNNHGGSLEECKKLFKAAADAGAQAVKLQKRGNASLYKIG